MLVQSATASQIASLKALGCWDAQFAEESGVDLSVMGIRAWWIFHLEDPISGDLDAWIDWLEAHHPDQDAELIDMALGCC